MPLMAFFIVVHTIIVLFQCHVAQCLAPWGAWPLCPPPPKSALDAQESSVPDLQSWGLVAYNYGGLDVGPYSFLRQFLLFSEVLLSVSVQNKTTVAYCLPINC